MFKKLKSFFNKIQNSDLNTRKKWLYIFSFIFIVLIIILWKIYLDLFFVGFNNSQEGNFFSEFKKEYKIFEKGLSEFGNELKENLKKIEDNLINKSTSIEINNQNQINSLLLENLENQNIQDQNIKNLENNKATTSKESGSIIN